jgi:hypothetical protein
MCFCGFYIRFRDAANKKSTAKNAETTKKGIFCPVYSLRLNCLFSVEFIRQSFSNIHARRKN